MSEYEEHSGDEIKCPYCGVVNTDSWEHDSERIYECENCWIPSKLEVDISVTYTTTPFAEILEDEIEDLEKRLREGKPSGNTELIYAERIAKLKATLAKLEVS
jgi:hypothetical protein